MEMIIYLLVTIAMLHYLLELTDYLVKMIRRR